MTAKHAYILHLVSDEKFIDIAYRQFEAVAPGFSRFVIIGEAKSLHYIKEAKIEFLSLRQFKRAMSDNNCSAVIFHSLTSSNVLRAVPESKNIIWLGWGYDYYDLLLSNAFPGGLLLPETAKLVRAIDRSAVADGNEDKVDLIQNWKGLLKRVLGIRNTLTPNVLSKIDYFIPVLDIEYEMVTRLNTWFKPAYVNWNYGTLEDDLTTPSQHQAVVGDNILVGNSADPRNNHVEVFDVLENCVDIGQRKIVVPLSYGSESYRDKIVELGLQRFGNQFLPLTEFMEKQAYIELLQSCGFVMMNHLRQQAVANICITMLSGAKVYLNEASPVYHWFRRRGAALDNIGSLSSVTHVKGILEPLCEVDRVANANVVAEHWGREVQLNYTRELIDIALRSDYGN